MLLSVFHSLFFGLCYFLYCRVKSRFFSRRSIFFNCFLLNGFVKSFNGYFEPFFGVFDATLYDRFSGFFYGALKYSFNFGILFCFALGYAHIFFGGLDDGHSEEN